MTGSVLPEDRHAEQSLAAIAAMSAHGARIAREVVDEVVDWRPRRIIEAAVELDVSFEALRTYRTVAEKWPIGERSPMQPWIVHQQIMGRDDREELGLEHRIDAVADAADVPRVVLRRWVDGCGVMFDASGALRRRVREAAQRRARILELKQALEAESGRLVLLGQVAS